MPCVRASTHDLQRARVLVRLGERERGVGV
jgi:hypothetical protein